MVSAIITAAGENKRMINDQKSRGMNIQHKLLLDLKGEPVIIKTLENVKNAKIDEIVIVLGHFNQEISSVLSNYDLNSKIKLIVNPDFNVELSETLLNGVKNVKSELCLCVAADQPTVSTETMNNLIKANSNKNMVTILARGKTGYLNSVKGLGMPFVCNTNLLRKYLPDNNDNLNPILNNMLNDEITFYGIAPNESLELVNINMLTNYVDVLNRIK